MILLLARGINLFQILAGYLLSRTTKKAIHWGNPVAVSIEPNNSCNLHCPECPAGQKLLTRPQGSMNPDLFKSIICELLPHLSYLTLYFQGEPYLCQHLFEFIAFARSKKIFVSTSTNGHFLNENTVRQTVASKLNRLIISLDGANQQSYEAYRQGGDFKRVVEGIRLLAGEKKRLKSQSPEVILQCLLLKSNESQLDDITALAKTLGVDKLEFKTAQFNDFENGNPLMPETDKYSRYKRVKDFKMENANSKMQNADGKVQNIKYKIQNVLPDSCFRMWSSCVITWDGKVVPCCFDKDATYVLGDLKKQRFTDIWRGEPAKKFRNEILQHRKSIDICSNCSQTF